MEWGPLGVWLMAAHVNGADRTRRTKAKAKPKPKAGAKAKAAPAARASTKSKAKSPSKPKPKAKAKSRSKPMRLELTEDYRPSEDEPFMNEVQREYFRRKLLAWKDEILRESRETIQNLQEDNGYHADLADRATSETEKGLELRARDRQRKLIAKIDAALKRIEDGTYGYCEETGEPISVRRLDARPIATLSIEAQERHERREKVYRDE